MQEDDDEEEEEEKGGQHRTALFVAMSAHALTLSLSVSVSRLSDPQYIRECVENERFQDRRRREKEREDWGSQK